MKTDGNEGLCGRAAEQFGFLGIRINPDFAVGSLSLEMNIKQCELSKGPTATSFIP